MCCNADAGEQIKINLPNAFQTHLVSSDSFPAMSWQSYVDDHMSALLLPHVTHNL
jgi:hypothetical protein